MRPERWQQVSQLFQSALEREPRERTLYLRGACGDDDALRRQVESLLAAHDKADDDDFINAPAAERAATLLMAEEALTGALAGHYKILKRLGAGGMGEVYLAEDTTLGRRVALKVLLAEIAHDQDRIRRFVQEAKSASALNHPNILTVYEVGNFESSRFIVTEFIKGETLRERMKSEPLALRDALDVALQVAAALNAAHEAGIVHRDIKPENIMVRDDGLVKVLDFGLAKLTEKRNGDVELEAETRAQVRTAPGTILGTVAYMSPEQARGKATDARTDIFSFGVVLYEMLAGQQPFTGETMSDTLAAILKSEPAPLARSVAGIPKELERIVGRTLRKNADERYQHVKDLLIDLRDLKQDLEFEAKFERSAAAPKAENATPDTPAATGMQTAQTTSSVEYVARQIKNHKFGFAALSFLLLAAVGFGAWFFSHRNANMNQIKSLGVLPLKSLDAGDNYLGLGIADAVIRRISQTGEMTVRPTSAVRRYLNEETDALTAARELNADAVLEGSVQRADDRLRVSVNLLRTSDGASLWASNFDMQMTDIFTIQDMVAQQVATHLRLQLDSSQQARLMKRYTSNAIAYQFYLKGVYSFDQRVSATKSQWETTIDFFKKAIEADPNFALAHAQLAYAYALMGVFVEPTETVWAERAKEEINRAQTLDPQLAETHLARFQLLFSASENYQVEAAVREVMTAQQLNPNVGHAELGYLYIHIGLEDFAVREFQRAAEIEPTSEFVKQQTLNMYLISGRYDEWLAAQQKLYPDTPLEIWYLLGKGRLAEAQEKIETTQKAIEAGTARPLDVIELPRLRALLFALKGDFRSAEAEIPAILGKFPVKEPNYHHAAYDIACIYALEGKTDEAVKWLREAVATGFQPYPLFERDAYLNRIRQTPEFIQFMTEMKAQNERYRHEFE
ncbi:MAG: protein kinase [Pyrinomonadaceae bacterium]